MLTKKLKDPVIRNTLIYMGTDAFSRGIAFLLLPIVSKYLLPEQLGIAANFDVLQSILSLLAGMATVNGLAYYFYKSSKERMAQLVSNLVWTIIVFNVLFSVIIFFANDIVNQYLHIGVMLQLLTVVSCVALLISDISKLISRLEDKPIQFAVLQLGQSMLYIGLQLFMVVHLEMQALGRIYSLVFSLLAFSLIHIVLLIKKGYLKFNFNWSAMKEMLGFGIPLLPHSLSFWLKSGMDKVLLTTYCGLTVNGLYSMAMSFGALYSMCEISFMKAYSPYLQKRIASFTPENEGKEKTALVRQSYQLGGAFILLYFVLIAVCWLVINYMINEKYLPCFEFIPWILLAATIKVFYSLTIEYIYTAKKTAGLGIITFTCSVIQLVLTYTLLQALGKEGIKISIVVGAFVNMACVWWYSNKVYPMPWFNIISQEKLWKNTTNI